MAIKIKNKFENETIPKELDEIIVRGFTYSALEKEFKAKAGEKRKEFKAYAESNEDGFNLTEKTLKTEHGSVTLTERKSFDFDVDKIQDLIDKKKVTLTTILQCCSFRGTDLEVALGSNFSSVATETASETLSFKPNSEFKSDVLLKAEVIEELLNEDTATHGSAVVIPTDEDSDVVAASIAKIKKPAFKKKKKAAKKVGKKSADSELDDILND